MGEESGSAERETGNSDNSHHLAAAEAATTFQSSKKRLSIDSKLHILSLLDDLRVNILLWRCEIMTLPHSGVSRTHIMHTQTKLVSYQIDAENDG